MSIANRGRWVRRNRLNAIERLESRELLTHTGLPAIDVSELTHTTEPPIDVSSWQAEAPTPGVFHVDNMLGDLNGDQLVDDSDIDELVQAIRTGQGSPAFDLDGSGLIDDDDLTILVEDILRTKRGDADLNGTVDFNDFLVVSSNFGDEQTGWSQGNFNTDQFSHTEFSDFLLLAVNFGFTRAASTSTVTMKNRVDTDRIQWVHTTIPFPKGQVKTENDLWNYSVDHGTIDWRPLKWHFTDGKKDSIALAALKVPMHLNAYEEVSFDVVEAAKPNQLPFAFGPNLLDVINRGTLVTDIVVAAKVRNDPHVYTALFLQNGRVIFDGPHSKSYSWHSNFETQALSMTFWLEVNNGQDFGNLVMSVGNQTFERLHSGGIDLEYVDLYVNSPFRIDIRHGSDYGAGDPQPSVYEGYRVTRLITDDIIADGAARTFRGLWGAIVEEDSPTGRSYLAELEDPLWGIADEGDWRESDAAGITGAISPPRGSLGELQAAVEWMCTDSFNVQKDAGNYPKYLNKNPSITGDQIDFSSNIPLVYQQAILSQSSCPIEHLMHAVQQETHRPVYYFYENRPMRWSDTSPNTWWWSGRIHYHPSQNPGNDEWLQRVNRHSGFEMGETFGWKGPDNQHYGNHHIRAAYELTGDAFLYDLIVYHQSMALWNHLGDGNQRFRAGSERGQRLLEDAIQDYVIAPDAPEAQKLATSIARKIHEAARPVIEDRLSRYGVAAWETVHGDNRYPGCLGTTEGGTPPENVCHVVWQSGFNLNALASAYRLGITKLWPGAHEDVEWIIDQFMDDQEFRFFSNGNNKSWVRFNDWSTSGDGFTHSWLSGWVPAVKLRQDHPNWPWFRDVFIPYMRDTSFAADRWPNHFWGGNDKWRNFE